MKILHVIPSVALVRGGPSQAVLGMVKALNQQGVNAEILTTNDNGSKTLDVPLNSWVEYEGLPIYFLSRFSPPISPIREFAYSSPWTKWLRENYQRYDLIHIHALFSYPSTISMAVARELSIPYILSPHGLLCQWSLTQSHLKKRLYLKLIEQKNINQSQGLHVTSTMELKEIADVSPTIPKFLIPLGIECSSEISEPSRRLRENYNIPAQASILLYLSRFHPKKGLEFSIEALAKLRNDQEFVIILAGNGSEEYIQSLKDTIEKADLSDRAIFTGFVTGEQKDLLLQGADLFFLTSHSENFGVVVLEAMAARLPVLLTPGVALAHQVEHEGVGYTCSLTVDSIFESFKLALSEPKERQLRGLRAKAYVEENYSWKNMSEELINVYQKVLNLTPEMVSSTSYAP